MSVDPLIPALRQFFGLEHVLPAGRAALGIYAALHAWSGGRAMTVAVPASVCQDVIAAVQMAGWTPYLCDVDPFTGLVPATEWFKARSAGAIAAIVVHLYGNPANTALVRRIFPAPACLLIDDAAQALGTRTAEGLAGTEGDLGIVSFGGTKHIEVGGAALLCRDARLLRECDIVLGKVIPTDVDAFQKQQAMFRQRYLAARERLVRNDDHRGFAGLLDDYAPLLRVDWQAQWGHVIAGLLATYPSALAQRGEKAALWSQAIAGSGLVPVGMSIAQGCAPWRYACRLPGCDWARQRTVGEAMREHGLQVSHWYLPGHWWFGEPHRTLPGSEQLARESFQFWVDERTSKDVIIRAGAILQNSIQG